LIVILYSSSLTFFPYTTLFRSVTVDRINEESLGHLIMFSQYFTAYAGEFYDIDAFDQPGVEYGKKLTFAMMGRSGFAEYDKKIRSEEHTSELQSHLNLVCRILL